MKRVYFLKPIGMAGPIKIGCSVLPEGRLKSLDIWSPFPLELIAAAPGEHRDERRLHWRFRKDRTHGEWFLVSADLLSVVDHVRLTGTLPPLEAVPSGSSGRPQRNRRWIVQKSQITRKVNLAERHAFGSYYYAPRPARIKELVGSYHGVHLPPPPPEITAELDEYVQSLRARPKCDLPWEQVRAGWIIASLAQRLAA